MVLHGIYFYHGFGRVTMRGMGAGECGEVSGCMTEESLGRVCPNSNEFGSVLNCAQKVFG